MKVRVLILIILLLGPVSPCFANLSGSWKPGEMMIDVEGVKDMHILREKLRIDLRNLKKGHLIEVTATYYIDNPLPPRDQKLTFITGSRYVDNIGCYLDNKFLPHRRVQVEKMPANWKPPKETPGYVPEEKLLYGRELTNTQHDWIIFTAPLKTGKQTIEVTYWVEAGSYYALNYPSKFWQTAYILAPARTWKSFGSLDLEILAPTNWPVKCNLPLNQDGTSWKMSFAELPADFIAITTNFPANKNPFLFSFLDLIYWLGILSLFFCSVTFIISYRWTSANPDSKVRNPKYHAFFWWLFLLSFLPLLLNWMSSTIVQSNVPDHQRNYQMWVVSVLFTGIYWLIFSIPFVLLVSPLLTLSRNMGYRWGKRRAKLAPSQTIHVDLPE